MRWAKLAPTGRRKGAARRVRRSKPVGFLPDTLFGVVWRFEFARVGHGRRVPLRMPRSFSLSSREGFWPESVRKKAGVRSQFCVLKPGKDAFHRVPDFSRNEWDAVECVLTILGSACWPLLEVADSYVQTAAVVLPRHWKSESNTANRSAGT
jgi:hypothetical protein